LRQPNFLILDEPTNDLDVLTLQKLEEYLDDFAGCIIMVSHDRFFVDRIADQLIVLDGRGNASVFGGSFSAFREQLHSTPSAQVSQAKEAEIEKEQAVQKPKTKLSYQQKRALELLPGEIEKLEEQKQELEEQIGNPMASYEDLKRWSEALSTINTELEGKMMQWMELEDMASGGA
jgi:ATP-binding cassette subfamily F protein uup